MKFQPRPAIKAQTLVDFILKCTIPEDPFEGPPTKLECSEDESEEPWFLTVDGSSNNSDSGAGLVLSNS